MDAEPSPISPRPSRAGGDTPRTTMGPRPRQVHRWTSIAFTLSVAANLVAMAWGRPPAWITFSPLPPLLVLLLTGLHMLGRRHLRAWRTPLHLQPEG